MSALDTAFLPPHFAKCGGNNSWSTAASTLPREILAAATYRHCRGMGWVLVRGRCLKAATRICSPRSRCALVRKRGIFRQSGHCFVIHHGDNTARPRLHFIPRQDSRQHRLAAVRVEPCDKVIILGAAEFLGHAHRAPPFRRTRHHAAILHAHQSRHYQNRIHAGADEQELNVPHYFRTLLFALFLIILEQFAIQIGHLPLCPTPLGEKI